MEVIKFKNVSEKYRIKFVINGKEKWEDTWALKDVNFSVEKGQTLAIIGENGAGKSTILKLIAGLLKTDAGEVCTKGRVSALLELGAGFYPEFTGRENLYLNASLFGLTKKEVDFKFSEIVEFSGIGRFIDAQVKSYSQGMFVRLAFSIAIHINPDILLIDDTLAVGDEDFQRKCINKILQLKEAGKIIIFVTHDMNMARRICKKGIFLRGGQILREGPIDSVITYYMETFGNRKGIGVIQKGDTGVIFNNGRLIFRWMDKTVTKDQGGYSSFSLSGHHFNSPTANWNVQVKDGQEIIARGQWLDASVAQIWKIKFLGNNQLQLKVELEIQNKAEIENFQIELILTDEYRRWFSSEHEGNFPENFFHERSCELIYDDPFDRLGGVKYRAETKDESLPSLIIDAFGQETEIFCQILNSGLDLSARIIRLRIPRSTKDDKYCLAMKVNFFGMSEQSKLAEYIHFAREMADRERQKSKLEKANIQTKSLVSGKCEFNISMDENNFLHIYYSGKKLTKDPGIKINLLIGAQWYDSHTQQACIEKISEQIIQIHNFIWKGLPIIQTWVFSMQAEGVLALSIKMDVRSPVKIKRSLVSIFLSDAYTKWVTLYDVGEFSGEFNEWQKIGLRGDGERIIGAISSELPTIILDISKDSKFMPNIYNSDKKFSAHLLQAESENIEYPQGKFEYFKGIIRISEDKIIKQEQSALGPIYGIESSIFNEEFSDDKGIYMLDDKTIFANAVTLSGAYKNNPAEIKDMYCNKKKLGIGISRFNFFRLDKIVKFYARILGKHLNLNPVSFNPFPVKSIYNNFIDYIKETKSAADAIGIKLLLKDKDLPDILKTISLQTTHHNDKELLRLLGVICEYAFIGPREIIIDSYHRCNTNCVHCWFHNPKAVFPEEYLDMKLDLDLYKKIVDDAQELSVEFIIFEGNGEPLLDDRFIEMAEYARDRDIKISFSTNGILLDREMTKKLVSDLDIEIITCSLPAATQNTYALINPKQDQATFNRIVENMKFFIKARNNLNIDKPILQMNHVIHALNCHELMDMARLDAEIGADTVQFCIIQNLADDNIKHLRLTPLQIGTIKDSLADIADFLNKMNIVLKEDINFQLKDYNENIEIPVESILSNGGCPIGWFQTLIFANSDVSACRLKIIGNLAKASFKEIWNSPQYQRQRVQAKYLKDNQDVTFMNKAKLYDEHCRNCATLAGIFKVNNPKRYNLENFLIGPIKNNGRE